MNKPGGSLSFIAPGSPAPRPALHSLRRAPLAQNPGAPRRSSSTKTGFRKEIFKDVSMALTYAKKLADNKNWCR
jgi:hypothetical protein